jgi:DNA-binding transcriptional ArsR family regulator
MVNGPVLANYPNGRQEIWRAARVKPGVTEAVKAFRAALAEGVTSEDILSTMKRRLGDYLQDVATAIRKDPDLIDKIPHTTQDLGPAVRTLKTHDGHEIRIHGNEDDGFRVSVRGRSLESQFSSLEEAEIATEMYMTRRRESQVINDDYVEDKHIYEAPRDPSPGKITRSEDPCWRGYHMVGTKKKGGRTVPNCVPGTKGQ